MRRGDITLRMRAEGRAVAEPGAGGRDARMSSGIDGLGSRETPHFSGPKSATITPEFSKTMADITINVGQVGIFTAFSADATKAPAPVTGGTVTISDYASAYVASTGTKDQYIVVPKVTLTPGQKLSFSVTFSGSVASDGTTVADFSVTVELDGAPAPPTPVATQFVLGATSTPNAADVTVPADPGAATIPVA